MKQYVVLLITELKMMFWGMKRYFVNTISMLVIMFFIFTGLFYGVKALAGASVNTQSLDAMIIGYVLWMSAMLVLQDIGNMILQESQMGTLEQLYLSPIRPKFIFIGKILSNLLFYFATTTVILYSEMLVTGRYLKINFLVFFLWLFVSLISLLGIGFAIGGLALIHKRIQAINSVLSFGLIGLMMLPVYPLNVFSFLPFIAGASTINAIIVKGATFPIEWYAFIIANSFAYLVLGMLLFGMIEKKARSMNKLSQY